MCWRCYGLPGAGPLAVYGFYPRIHNCRYPPGEAALLFEEARIYGGRERYEFDWRRVLVDSFVDYTNRHVVIPRIQACASCPFVQANSVLPDAAPYAYLPYNEPA